MGNHIDLKFLPIRHGCKIPLLPDDLTSKNLCKYHTMVYMDTRKTNNERTRRILYLAKRNVSKENNTKVLHRRAVSNGCEQEIVRNE